MINELFPVVCGAMVGLLVGLVRPALRLWTGAALAVALGLLATVVSGEFRISWEFLLIDIPLVAGSAAATLVVGRLLGKRPLRNRG